MQHHRPDVLGYRDTARNAVYYVDDTGAATWAAGLLWGGAYVGDLYAIFSNLQGESLNPCFGFDAETVDAAID